jgi:hypothetical protein
MSVEVPTLESFAELGDLSAWFRADVLTCEPRCCAAILVGSCAEGLANLVSDIDIVVVHERSHLAEQHQELQIGNRCVSLASINYADAARRLGELDSMYCGGSHQQDALVTRLASGRLLFDRDGRGKQLLDAYRHWRPEVSTLAAIMQISVSFYLDALGALGINDVFTAEIMARQGASIAIDAFLLGNGLRNLKSKWHLRRLHDLNEVKLLDLYLSALGLIPSAEPAANRLATLACTVAGASAIGTLSEGTFFRSRPRSFTESVWWQQNWFRSE